MDCRYGAQVAPDGRRDRPQAAGPQSRESEMPEQGEGGLPPAGPATAPEIRADIAVVGGGLVGLALAVALNDQAIIIIT